MQRKLWFLLFTKKNIISDLEIILSKFKSLNQIFGIIFNWMSVNKVDINFTKVFNFCFERWKNHPALAHLLHFEKLYLLWYLVAIKTENLRLQYFELVIMPLMDSRLDHG